MSPAPAGLSAVLDDGDAERERSLLYSLGLPAASSPEEIETAHRNVIDYLAHAPRDLKDWARRQAAHADAAYALLLDPVAATDTPALAGRARPAAQPGEPATPPARRATSRATAFVGTKAAIDQGGTDGSDDLDELDALVAEVSPDLHRDVGGRPAARAAAGATPRASGRRVGRSLRRVLVVALVALGVGGIAIAGYNAGAPAAPAVGGTGNAASAQPLVLDQAKVASLMTKLQADPRDTEALFGLADEYFATDDFATAEMWLTKLLAIDPKNVRAMVALGAAKFNSGDVAAAADRWTAALALDPTSVEAHYDLGFLFYSAEPQDLVGVRREWSRVIELAPGTDLASTVQAHLDSLASAPPSGAPSGSSAPSAGSVAPSAGSAASPAASSTVPARSIQP